VVRKSRRLLPGEDPLLSDFGSARRWLTIYEEREALLAADANALPQEIEDIAAGVVHWRRRVTELSGLSLDSDRRMLNVGEDRDVLLTPRELQLLEFLVQHPDRYFADHVLAVRAWGDRLSGDQVRIYVRRLRVKLEGSGWELVSRRGYGYSLTRHPATRGNGHARSVAMSSDKVQRVLGRARMLLQVQRNQLDLAIAAAEQLRKSLDDRAPAH
jgi:DNA-binding winged helix-turn-helix (wHTH) protein